MKTYECQIPCLKNISEGDVDVGPQPFRTRVGAMLRRRLSAQTKQAIKRQSRAVFALYDGLTKKPGASPVAVASLQAGDLVRVRSREEVEVTLDRWKALKGCSFMPEMWTHCDTTQRVLRRVDRFFDERDRQLKRIRGVVLLAGTMCQGTALFGRCDRSCFFFWREEWLEKIY